MSNNLVVYFKGKSMKRLLLFLAFFGAYLMPMAPGHTLERKKFFEDVVGMSEGAFRKQYGWTQGKLKKYNPAKQSQFIAEFPRRAAIFQGSFSFMSVNELTAAAQKKGFPANPKPQFRIIIEDPNNQQNADIRYLQTMPQNYGAAFQLASTFFGPLEGGMYDWNAYLTHMLHSPVQGEEASIAAAGATIYRKYFMPSYYLLYHLKNKLPMGFKAGKPFVDNAYAYKYEASDIGKVGIGIHQDIYVTSGYGDIGTSTQERLDLNQKVTQIFCSAYNTSNARKHKKMNRHIEDLCKMILKGDYEGTVKAAYVVGTPKVYLTMMGAGAFRNEISWLQEALERREFIDFIKRTNLEVVFIYRPDKKRDNAVRNPKDDTTFLKSLLRISDEINKTNLAGNAQLNQMITDYVYAGYDYKIKDDQKACAIFTRLAPEIQHYLNAVPVAAAPQPKAAQPQPPASSIDPTVFLKLAMEDKIAIVKQLPLNQLRQLKQYMIDSGQDQAQFSLFQLINEHIKKQ